MTDDLNITLEYQLTNGLLNIFVKSIGDSHSFPRQINVLSDDDDDDDGEKETSDNCCFGSGTDRMSRFYRLKIDFLLLDDHDKIVEPVPRVDYSDEPVICIEVTNIYVYDLYEENEIDLQQTALASSLYSSSSYCDEPSTDNDDGYSTHSLDDTEQTTHSLSMMSSCRMLVPISDCSLNFVRHEQVEEISILRRWIEQSILTNPLRKTIRQMMINPVFG